MITSIFSDRDEVEAVEHLSRDNAQAFVDTIDEASSRTIVVQHGEQGH